MNIQKGLGKPATGKSTVVRPRFSAGLMLQDDDLTLAVDYIGNLSRLLFKSLFGCGVICGFRISPTSKCGLQVKVDKGLALDCHGDPVQLPSEATVSLEHCPLPATIDKLWVAIRRKEYQCSPRSAVCAPEEDDESTQVYTRLRDGYELQLFETLPECNCGCKGKPLAQDARDPAGHGAGNQGGQGNVAAQGDANQAAPAAAAPGVANQGGRNAPAQAAAAPAPNAEADQPIYYGRDEQCYVDHYSGVCACDCCCDWVVLGRVYKLKPNNENNENNENNRNDGNDAKDWDVDYSVRRFVRPVLMRDPTEFKPAQ